LVVVVVVDSGGVELPAAGRIFCEVVELLGLQGWPLAI